jgi:hypothetical protein
MVHVELWDDPINYTVEGSGDFPLDMLRRDMAFPRTSADAAAITLRGPRKIDLTASAARWVAVKRWESFGWRVVDADLFPYVQSTEGESE